MTRKTTLLAVLLGVCLTVQAQTAKEEIANNRFLSGSNYLDYDNYPATKPLTKAPKGYEPYYLTHYGRHGSRWLLNDGDYMDNIKTLRKAQQLGKLTAKGAETLQKLERFYPCTVKRLGDLTTVGERQHHGIGRRMAEHFPEIFLKKNVSIDARSTVVVRCILSMTAECEELQGANPTARIHNDVSESLQYYLNQSRSRMLRETSRKGQGKVHEYRTKYTHPERLTSVLFNDPQYVKDSVNAGHFMRELFDVAANMQSHDTDIELLSLFTDEELYDQWRIRNVGWFVDYANTPITDGLMPFSQENLLENIILTADTVTKVQATLRFGHEVCVMPLACLLELDNCGKSISDLDHLDDVWRNYNIFPMACNIQLVFYRPKKGKDGDILVKALLNEREATMPVSTDQWPYYKWSDLRKYYKDKLNRYAGIKKAYEEKK
jgi:hypothetical protein